MQPDPPSLPSDHAFVVQFRAQTLAPSPSDMGRVEHVVTGRATHFASWAELQAFIEQTLAQVRNEPP